MRFRILLVAILLCSVVVSSARAGLDFDRASGRWVKLAYLHSSLDRVDTDVADANLLLSGRVGLTDQMAFRLELPVTRASVDVPTGNTFERIDSSVMGNVYLAVDVPKENGKGTWEFGVWLPTAPDSGGDAIEALFLAAANDLVAGFERYFPDTKGAQAMVHFHEPLLGGSLQFRGDIGTSVADLAGNDWKAFLMLGGQLSVGLPVGPRAALGVRSRTSMGDVDDQLAFVDGFVELEFGGSLVRPSLEFRRALDEDRGAEENWTLGVALTASLP